MARPGVDVAIVGAGLVGCAIAREAARAGARVVVFERAPLVPTPLDPGLVAAQCDADAPDALFELRLAGRAAFPAWVAALEEESGVRVPVRETGTLVPAFDLPELEAVHQRASWQRRRQLAFETLTAGAARDRQPGLTEDLVAALYLRDDRGVDAGALHAAALRACVEADVEVHLATPVLGVVRRGDAVTGVHLPEGQVEAGVTVVCGGAWSGAAGLPAIPLDPSRVPVCVLGQNRGLRMGLWHPRFTASPLPDGRVVVAGVGERAGFDERLPAGNLARTLEVFLRAAPGLAALPVIGTGTVMRAAAPDGLPLLGSGDAVSLVYATGHGEHATVLAPITARLVVEYLQLGAPSMDWSAFSPVRFSA